MAERLPRNVITKARPLHGIIIQSTIDSGLVLDIKLPELDNRFLAIGSKDVTGNNHIPIFDDSIPLFTSSRISYKGQPLMALFGPDTETVEVKAREIEVEYQLADAGSNNPPPDETAASNPATYAWGDLQAVMAEALGFVERTYTDRSVSTCETMVTFAKAQCNDDFLNIEVPTQWPFHVRDSVAEVCGKQKKKIIVTPTSYFAIKDEKLILPSILASIAALAAIKSGQPVQIGARLPTYRPLMRITRKTALDASRKPIAETVQAFVDQGAYALFSEEMFKQILSGLCPQYPLQAFSVQVHFTTSDTPPAHFYGDLGYSTALFSSEAHASALAKDAQMNPANWRLKYYSESPQRAPVLATLPYARLRDLIGGICVKSDYARHNAVYELQRRTKNPLSTFLNYSRGMGIACGAGCNGFSATFAPLQQYHIGLTLDANGHVQVDTSYYPTQKMVSLWKKIIAKTLGVDRDTIDFVCENTSDMLDSGPNVLSQDVDPAASMLIKCCESIKSRRFQEPLPLSETVSTRSVVSNTNPLFTSGTWGTLVVELEINTVSLVIEIRHIWGSFAFSNILDQEQLLIKLRHIITMSLYECGASFSKETGRKTSLDIDIEDQNTGVVPSSVSSALRGMVLAAFSSALSQALNNEVDTLPVCSEDILGYFRRSE
ncbi:MAG: molybdopterin cofactor-binding domain-containing protein [Sphaerochaetaceae bacterium]